MRGSFNFNHLECFFSLARTLSFSKTSLELKVAQPAVSKQIKSLEDQFGMQLFVRTRQRVSLSSAGKKLYDEVWPLYSTMCSRITEITSKSDQLQGKIVFGCLAEVGEKVFIHAINRFKKKNPYLKFEIRFLKAFEIIHGIKEGKIDIGIVPDEIIQENIRVYEILEEEIILVTSRQNKEKNIKSITSLPFVSFRENDPLLEYYLRRVHPKLKLNRLNIELSVNSHKAMVDVVKKNSFYAVLPTLSIRNELKRNELVNVGQKSLKSKLYLIHMDLPYLDKKVVSFRDFLRKNIEDYL